MDWISAETMFRYYTHDISQKFWVLKMVLNKFAILGRTSLDNVLNATCNIISWWQEKKIFAEIVIAMMISRCNTWHFILYSVTQIDYVQYTHETLNNVIFVFVFIMFCNEFRKFSILNRSFRILQWKLVWKHVFNVSFQQYISQSQLRRYEKLRFDFTI